MLPGGSVPRFCPERRVRISIKSIGAYPPPTTDGCWITVRLSRTTFFDIYRSEKQNWHLWRSQPRFQVRPRAVGASHMLYSVSKWIEIRNVERSQLGSGMVSTSKQKLAIPTEKLQPRKKNIKYQLRRRYSCLSGHEGRFMSFNNNIEKIH